MNKKALFFIHEAPQINNYTTIKSNDVPICHIIYIMYVIFTKILLFFFLKNVWDPIRPYCDLNIHLRNLRKWFETIPHHEIHFVTLHTSLTKLCKLLIKLHIFLRIICIFFEKKNSLRQTETPIILNSHLRELEK